MGQTRSKTIVRKTGVLIFDSRRGLEKRRQWTGGATHQRWMLRILVLWTFGPVGKV